jgi:hypothetical protein
VTSYFIFKFKQSSGSAKFSENQDPSGDIRRVRTAEQVRKEKKKSLKERRRSPKKNVSQKSRKKKNEVETKLSYLFLLWVALDYNDASLLPPAAACLPPARIARES